MALGLHYESVTMKKASERTTLAVLAVGLIATWSLSAARADSVVAARQNVLNLSASASVDAQQDWVTVSLGTSRDGPEPAQVQAQLKAALDQALTQARRDARPKEVEVRTGQFNLSPRYGKDGRISGWAGAAELVIEGRDIARIGQMAGQLQPLTVNYLNFSLSRDARQRVETEAQQLAIQRFQSQAAALSKSFGFGGYGLIEVQVGASDAAYAQPRAMAMKARGPADDAALPLEAGKTQVTVTVNGAVQMR
jgi:predicted secreted protein